MGFCDFLKNRVTEKDIRDYLESQGYEGPSAKFDSLELVAVQRPGWVQIFEFVVRVSQGDDRQQFYGVAKDDERNGITVFLGKTQADQERTSHRWSEGLIRHRSEKLPFGCLIALMVGFGLLLVLSIARAVFS